MSLVALGVAAAATALLARLALERDWVDLRAGLEDRKPRRTPVPLVGGAAIVLGLLAWDLFGGRGLPWPALLVAFVLGTFDDVRPGGLTVRQKLAGQIAVGLLLALVPGEAGVDGFAERVALGLLAVVAMNAVNTWDNADGAAGGLGVLALSSHPGALGALLGFLPFNLLLRRRGADRERVPRAMLGDAGSHVLGVLVAATPGAEVFLLVPLLDLARLAVVRRRVGRQPWMGDRRHVSHRLEAMGLGPVAVAAALAIVVAPPWLAQRISRVDGALLSVSLVVSAALWLSVVQVTPDPDEMPGDVT